MKTLILSLLMTSLWASAQANDYEAATILKDKYGRTLYTFDPDQGQAVPTCNAACAEKWPPYILSDAEVAQGVQAPYSITTRATGLKQVALDGKPLYLFFADRVVADAKGDGLGGVWHVVHLARE